MKIERLYAITIYLLNHGKTSAKELAKHFEVSIRTIQRDVDSLSMAGIPITAFAGAAGGYQILDTFKLDAPIATTDDYSYILTALQGLASATNDKKAQYLLEKIMSVSGEDRTGIVLDFSVLREGDVELMQTLRSAVMKKQVVNFTYTNNDNKTRTHSVEPIAVIYRWYAWYLLAYSGEKGDYRTYKLIRMQDVKLLEQPFSREHASADIILKNSDKTDSRKYISLLVKCKKAVVPRVREYLNGTVLSEPSNDSVLMELTVVENEQLWIGTLLSLGDAVEIIEPVELRKRLLTAAEKIVSLYH